MKGNGNEKDPDDCHSSFVYEWVSFHLPLVEKTLRIRTIRSNVALLDSHVGEELWDAAKIFSAHLCFTSDCAPTTAQTPKKSPSKCTISQSRSFGGVSGRRLMGKRVLELGAGVGSLGMCVAAIGAEQVLCTDYDADVLENLEFNLKHNMHLVYPIDPDVNSEEEAVEEEINPNCQDGKKLHSAMLDWRSFADEDLCNAEWLSHGDHEGEITTTKSRVKEEFVADIVIGSALVYSLQGALYCADTIKHFLIDRHPCQAEECWILQMPGRPGFDRFLTRLDHWGLIYEAFDISEDAFHAAVKHMGNLKSEIDDFKLYVIKKA